MLKTHLLPRNPWQKHTTALMGVPAFGLKIEVANSMPRLFDQYFSSNSISLHFIASGKSPFDRKFLYRRRLPSAESFSKNKLGAIIARRMDTMSRIGGQREAAIKAIKPVVPMWIGDIVGRRPGCDVILWLKPLLLECVLLLKLSY